jgi:hypothetical protein
MIPLEVGRIGFLAVENPSIRLQILLRARQLIGRQVGWAHIHGRMRRTERASYAERRAIRPALQDYVAGSCYFLGIKAARRMMGPEDVPHRIRIV